MDAISRIDSENRTLRELAQARAVEVAEHYASFVAGTLPDYEAEMERRRLLREEYLADRDNYDLSA